VARRAKVKGQEMVRCRAYGHPWVDYGWLAMIVGGLRLWSQDFECSRCKATRHDRRARATFDLLRRWYDLPAGYPGRMSRAEALRALIDEGSPMSEQQESVVGA
jgi:hypothetical protein